MSAYGAWWYPRDMHQLEIAVRQGDTNVELRHRINTWGNVGTILLSNLIAIIAFAAIGSKSMKDRENSASKD